jgi:hypothetical protein
MYRRDEAGAFVQLGRLRFGRGEAGAWQYIP